MQSPDLNERLRTFFDDFIERMLVRDLRVIHSTNHPMRFRREIIDRSQSLLHDDGVRIPVTEEYVKNQIAADHDHAMRLYVEHLTSIHLVFGEVDNYFHEITASRRKLESRLRNTVRYMERSDASVLPTLARAIVALDSLSNGTNDTGLTPAGVPAMLFDAVGPYAPHLLASPQTRRAPIDPEPVRRRQRDPAISLYRKLVHDFNALFNVPPSVVKRFLERNVPPFGEKEAKHIQIGSLEDFIAFDQARRYLIAGIPPEIGKDFELLRTDGEHACDWIRCPNFLVRRKSDNITFIEGSKHAA